MKRLTMIAVTLCAPILIAQPPKAHAPQDAKETVTWANGVNIAYDGSGGIMKMGPDTFGYDDVGRMVEARINTVTRDYDYDAFGNRKNCQQSAPGDCQSGGGVNTTNNHLSQATYSQSGNIETLLGHTYSYDALNMMTRDTFGTAREFIYTADDQRIAIYSTGTNASWRWTVRDVSGRPLREITSNDANTQWTWARDFVWRDNALLATRQADTINKTVSTYHYHADHLGTPRRVTDDNEHIVGVHDYFAFGPEVATSTNEPFGGTVKYTSQERDAWSGSDDALDYMHARYYSSYFGAFTSVDPENDLKDSTELPQKWNRYSYVDNRPLTGTDPTGRVVEAVFHERLGILVVKDLDTGKILHLKAFSGYGKYQNNAKYKGVKDKGPIPPGRYLIGLRYDRAPGEAGNYEWYRLYGENGTGGYSYSEPGTKVVLPDGKIVYRDGMNLHVGLVSDGCLTVPSQVPDTDANYPTSKVYDELQKMLDKTSKMEYNGSKFNGTLTVDYDDK